MTVWLGNYPIATDNGASYQRQRDAIKSAIKTYGTDHIGGVTVGNEFMLKYVAILSSFIVLSYRFFWTAMFQTMELRTQTAI